MELWMHALSEFGFPMTITFYLLYRMEKKLDLINQSILQLHQRTDVPSLPLSNDELSEEPKHLS
ncbi:MAG: YvrJ family protein [Alkalicoccus sp.]|nr:MAG: YvrJ family protein [Alkalicoccus sp.]